MRRRLGVLIVALALGGVFFIDVCDLVFDCGCRSLWDGAASACNIHAPEPPHCPWCARPLAGGGVAFGAAALAQAAILFGPWSLGSLARFVLALVVFPAASAAVGIAQAWWWGYP